MDTGRSTQRRDCEWQVCVWFTESHTVLVAFSSEDFVFGIIVYVLLLLLYCLVLSLKSLLSFECSIQLSRWILKTSRVCAHLRSYMCACLCVCVCTVFRSQRIRVLRAASISTPPCVLTFRPPCCPLHPRNVRCAGPVCLLVESLALCVCV